MLAAGDGDGLVKQVNKKVKGTGALIALFVNDDRLKRTTMAAFSVTTIAAGNEACVAVNKAFQVCSTSLVYMCDSAHNTWT